MKHMKTFAPVCITAHDFDTCYPRYIEDLRTAGATRVCFCGIAPAWADKASRDASAARFGKFARIFEDAGFEVAAWLGGTLGRGGDVVDRFDSEYTHAENLDGKVSNGAFCPLDEKFTAAFCDFVQELVKNGAKMIMLDDDYRMELKAGEPFCFCEHHRVLMEQYLGRPFDREEFRGIFTGGPCAARDAFIYAQGEGLRRLARALRAAVDELDPTVRMGHCAVLTTWDVEGVDSIALTRILAGGTKPFLRLIGAAYWGHLRTFGCINLSAIVEYERMQAHWCRDSGIEIFAEGDVYPRPRYVVPSAFLELLDLSLHASGGLDGNLKFMCSPDLKANADRGYLDRHNRNAAAREWLETHFDGMETLGLRIFEPIHTIARSARAENYGNRCVPASLRLAAYNAVPSKFDGEGLTVIWGDAAHFADEETLKHGAVLDGAAAEILVRRGFDIGAVSVGAEYSCTTETYHGDIGDSVGLFGARAFEMELREGAEVLSTLNGKHPGSYFYRDAAGRPFLVYAFDGRSIAENTSFFDFSGISGNYRKQQLHGILDRLGVDFPYCAADAPFLYMIAKRNERAMSVYLMNAFEDGVFAPEVNVGEGYTRVESCGCTAVLSDGRVVLSDIAAYASAAFTVYRD